VTNSNYAIRKCFLPQESTVVYTYIVGITLTVLWFLCPRKLLVYRRSAKRSWWVMCQLKVLVDYYHVLLWMAQVRLDMLGLSTCLLLHASGVATAPADPAMRGGGEGSRGPFAAGRRKIVAVVNNSSTDHFLSKRQHGYNNRLYRACNEWGRTRPHLAGGRPGAQLARLITGWDNMKIGIQCKTSK